MSANDGHLGGEGPQGDGLEGEPDYHLLLAPEEATVLHTALDLAISDFAGQGQIRDLARAVIARLPEAEAPTAPEAWPASIPLEAREMKIVHTAAHLLLDDLQREQADEIEILRRIVDKLPDEHAIRAISLD
jgi:hypothetical protein